MIIDCVSSEDIVRLNESPVPVEVLVVGDRDWDCDFDCRFGIIRSSHRRSCKPVLSGSFPLDLSESEKDLPGDLRMTAPPASRLLELGGMVVGGVVRAGARGGEG